MRSFVFFRLSLFFLGTFFFACSPPSAPLQLVVYYPYGDDGTKLFNRITKFELLLDGPQMKDGAQSVVFERDAAEPGLRGVNCTKGQDEQQLEVLLKGLDEKEKVISVARQVLLHPCGQKRDIFLFLSPTEEFASLSKYEAGQTLPNQLEKPRAGHRLTSLSDGRVLVSGGAELSSDGKLLVVYKGMEIYDPESGQISALQLPSSPRAFHTAAVSGDLVILAGGLTIDGSRNAETVRTVEIFELTSDGLTKKTDFQMEEGRALHSMHVSPEAGYLFFAGGITQTAGQAPTMSKTWEVYRLDGQKISSGALPAEHQRAWYASSRLADGRVWMGGGLALDTQGKFQALASASLAQFGAGDTQVSITPASPLKEARAAPSSTTLLDGKLVISGGMKPSPDSLFRPQTALSSFEFLDPAGQILPVTLSMQEARTFHSTHLLEDGRLLVFGGLGTSGIAKRTEIYTPDSATILQPTPSLLTQRKDRFLHTGVLLLNGSLLVLGGLTFEEASPGTYVTLTRGELFTPRR